MADKVDVRQGTLALMILKTKEARDRQRTTVVPARFFAPAEES